MKVFVAVSCNSKRNPWVFFVSSTILRSGKVIPLILAVHEVPKLHSPPNLIKGDCYILINQQGKKMHEKILVAPFKQ